MAQMNDNSKAILSKSFTENHKDVSEDEAGALIVQSEQKLKQLTEEKESHPELTAAKQIVKDLQSGFTAASRYEHAKIRFLLERIEEIQTGEVNPSSAVNKK